MSDKIVKTLEFLSACYPLEFQKLSASNMAGMVKAWSGLFQDEWYTEEWLLKAAQRHVMGENGRSFPTPRDLIEQMNPMYLATEDYPDERRRDTEK